MVNKGFPKFGMSQAGSFVAALKNYNLPDFILVLIAKECKSELLERGRIDDRKPSDIDKGIEVFGLSSYNSTKVSEIKNKMNDDLRILFTEYRQKRKGGVDSNNRRNENIESDE